MIIGKVTEKEADEGGRLENRGGESHKVEYFTFSHEFHTPLEVTINMYRSPGTRYPGEPYTAPTSEIFNGTGDSCCHNR